MRQFSLFFITLVLGMVFLIPASTKAASLYIDPATSELYRGDSVTLSVRLDTNEAENECINAVDAVINYSDNIDPVDVSVGDSIFNVWVEKPIINKENKTITFAGGIPNGYCGRVVGDPKLTNVLAKIIFRSPGFMIGARSDSDKATISFSEATTAYLNNGQGTIAKLTTYPAEISLNPSTGGTITNSWQEEIQADKIAPEKFSIYLEKDDQAFSQKYYIIFNTTDKQTGIHEYQVMEEPISQFGSFQWGRADAPWITARSPYVLKDQKLNSIIRVKAVDKAGNEYIATFAPDESLRGMSYANLMLLFVLIVGAGVFLVVVYFVVRKLLVRIRSSQNRKESLLSESEENEN